MAELAYRKNGDYQIPELVLDGEEELEGMPIGKYGMLRQSFLLENHQGTYTSMLLTGRLIPHLRQIDGQAQEQVERMVAEMMRLKERDQMAWVQAVNSLTAQAEEAVLQETVYQ
jgi:hypothetical protein